TDIIGNLVKTGNWFKNLKADHAEFETIVKKTNAFTVNLELYQNAGANMVQQLTYALAHATEYLNHLETVLSDEEKKSFQITFNLAVGTNYFFEIAKIRALRALWPSLATAYRFNTECIIFANPSKRNKTLYDY